EQIKPRVADAEQARKLADDRTTEARTLLNQSQQSLREITELDGSGRCRHCGQPLTPSHLQEEKRRRKADRDAAEKRYHSAVAEQRTAQAREQQVRDQLQSAEKAHQEARDDFRVCKNQIQQTQKDIERLQHDLAKAYSELTEPFRSRVSVQAPVDWL